MCADVCVGSLGGQRRVFDPLEQEAVVGSTPMWVMGTLLRTFAKAASPPNYCAISSPYVQFLN